MTGVQLRALQASRPHVPGEGEHGAAPGAVGGRAGAAGPHAHVPLHRPTQGRGGLVGREAEGGRRGAGTVAGGTGPLAVPGGRLQQPRYSQGEVVSQYALSIDIKCCGTLSAFRKALKTHILKAYYC